MYPIDMKKTLTLDADVAEQIQQETVASHLSFEEVVNRRLREGFCILPSQSHPSFRVTPHRSGYVPGVDASKLHQLLDKLDADHFSKTQCS